MKQDGTLTIMEVYEIVIDRAKYHRKMREKAEKRGDNRDELFQAGQAQTLLDIKQLLERTEELIPTK